MFINQMPLKPNWVSNRIERLFLWSFIVFFLGPSVAAQETTKPSGYKFGVIKADYEKAYSDFMRKYRAESDRTQMSALRASMPKRDDYSDIIFGMVELHTDPTLSRESNNKYAFLVGVETYDTSVFQNLNYAEEDAVELGNVLETLGYATTVMTSQARDAKLKPVSAKSIVEALRGRLSGLDEFDTVVVAFSGHGVQFADDPESDGPRETYFCPEGAKLADRTTLVPISKIIEMVESCKARRKLVLIDSCRNEVLSDAGSRSIGRKIDLGQVHASPQIYSEGMAVLFSCSKKQKSWEHKELGHGVFTNFVIEFFKGNADQELYDQDVGRLNDLVYFVSKKTHDFVLDKFLASEGQLPVLTGTYSNWPLCRFPTKVIDDDELLSKKAECGEALAWLIDGASDSKVRQTAARMMFEHFSDTSFVESALSNIEIFEPVRSQIQLFDQIIESHPEREIRAKALYYKYRFYRSLEASLARIDNYSQPSRDFLSSLDLDVVNRNADRIVDRVAADFDDVMLNETRNISNLLNADQFERRRLQIGMEVPDINGKDLDGIEFSLSDYRGKVVVLRFWGDW